jgi:hypothetical protein
MWVLFCSTIKEIEGRKVGKGAKVQTSKRRRGYRTW